MLEIQFFGGNNLCKGEADGTNGADKGSYSSVPESTRAHG